MASEVTRMRFRLGAELTAIVSAAQATALIGKEIPMTWGEDVKVMAKVIEVTTDKDGTQVLLEAELPSDLAATLTTW